ncbi:hypothetical protein ACFQ3Z_43170 [Streptomyces nogalater]
MPPVRPGAPRLHRRYRRRRRGPGDRRERPPPGRGGAGPAGGARAAAERYQPRRPQRAGGGRGDADRPGAGRDRPGQLGYVNTHGTASPLGDRTEAAALLRVLGPDAPALVNATKALTGHCLSAAGVVEAVATVAQLAGGFAHPNPWLADPVEPRLRFTGTAEVPLAAEFALSNSFGFAGFHSAVIFANEGV